MSNRIDNKIKIKELYKVKFKFYYPKLCFHLTYIIPSNLNSICIRAQASSRGQRQNNISKWIKHPLLTSTNLRMKQLSKYSGWGYNMNLAHTLTLWQQLHDTVILYTS